MVDFYFPHRFIGREKKEPQSIIRRRIKAWVGIATFKNSMLMGWILLPKNVAFWTGCN